MAPTAHVLSLSQCPVGAPIFTCAPLQSVPHPAARGAFGKCHLLAINLPVSSQPLNKIANPSTVVFGDPRLHLSDFIPSQSSHHPHSTHPTDPGLLSAPQIHEAPPLLRALHELATVNVTTWAFQAVLVVKNPLANAGDRRPGFDPCVGKVPWRRAWQPTPVSLPGGSNGQRSLAGYSPQC